MDRFDETDEVRGLPCSHYFHKACIDRWFATKRYQSRSCPLCKRNPIADAEATVQEGDEEGLEMTAAAELFSSGAEQGVPSGTSAAGTSAAGSAAGVAAAAVLPAD